MAQVKNKLRQPLTVNTAEGAIHFLSKQTKEVNDALLSTGELKNHVDKGNLIVIRIG